MFKNFLKFDFSIVTYLSKNMIKYMTIISRKQIGDETLINKQAGKFLEWIQFLI